MHLALGVRVPEHPLLRSMNRLTSIRWIFTLAGGILVACLNLELARGEGAHGRSLNAVPGQICSNFLPVATADPHIP